MEMISIEQELRNNSYPGRGIILGMTPDGRHAAAAYFIMGRSSNSRNRVFVEDGEGHFISTYQHDGNPLPSFEGEPKRIAVPDDIDAFAELLWKSLNEENKVSLFVRYINIENGTYETRIINKNK
ncbi:IMP cyclohydrolase-like protein [[Clostridium] aminophilum]|uniref:IMP cyclohydrolase-like protein n=1 Tax=[Clostridium] aminophilum TaxID=1526 RepID=A0A1I0DZK1_9FIRM|nr:IMP cyclohydrolase [[Clostridium] aminophilum]SET37885.1 IMP cyclohydrolase-like protein [[Clostridium] aminophilum]